MNKRKPLNDALAEKFVYGQEPPLEDPPLSKESPTPSIDSANTTQEPTLMERLLETQEQKEATKRFTVDLPESMHRKLSILAARSGRKKADIVRVLLDDLLKNLDE
jgi:predicted DNA-binding protein